MEIHSRCNIYRWKSGPYGLKISTILEKECSSSPFIEYVILSQLSHVKIIECPYIEITDSKILYMLKHYKQNLFEWQNKQLHMYKVSKFKEIFSQVCDALIFLHSNDIVHGDIKPTNIVIDKMQIALIDFDGSSISCNGVYKEAKTTYVFKSPEATMNEYHGPANDIWALGITMIIYFHGMQDWMKLDEDPLLNYIVNEDIVYDGPFKDIIYRCLDQDYTKRPTAYELLNLINPTYKVNKGEIMNCNNPWYNIFKSKDLSRIIHDPYIVENLPGIMDSFQDEN